MSTRPARVPEDPINLVSEEEAGEEEVSEEEVSDGETGDAGEEEAGEAVAEALERLKRELEECQEENRELKRRLLQYTGGTFSV